MKIIERISTGCEAFDQLLNGGIEKGHITEIFGEGGAGKTNICIQTAITESLKGNRVIYVDTEGISPERMAQILGDGPRDMIKNILFYRPYTLEEQESAIKQAVRLAKMNNDITLVIIDSLTEFYRAELSNTSGSTMPRLWLSRQLSKLSRLSKMQNIAVLVTNQVYMDVNTKELMPLGGYTLNHIAKTIVQLKKIGIGKRKAVLQKHRSIEEGRTIWLKITNRGIEGYKGE